MDIETARDKIEHVIVLMLENRSFDHVLGALSLREGRTDIDGLREELQLGNFDDKNHFHEIHPLAANIHYGKRARRFEPDLPHGTPAVKMQIGRSMDGFIRAFQKEHPGDPWPQSVMGYLTRAEQPITYALADNFVVCDRWFSPVPSNTIPNRMYSLAGHCMGLKGNPRGTSFFGVEELGDDLRSPAAARRHHVGPWLAPVRAGAVRAAHVQVPGRRAAAPRRASARSSSTCARTACPGCRGWSRATAGRRCSASPTTITRPATSWPASA